MPLDTRIPLMAQPVQLPDFNALAQQRAETAKNNFMMQRMQRQDQAEQNAMMRRQQVGSLAAQGNVKGAQQSALEGGDFELFDTLSKLDDTQRKAAKGRTDAIASVALAVRDLPYEQRRAAIASAAPYLANAGVSEEEAVGFDPTDQNIGALVSSAQTVAETFARLDKDRSFKLDTDKFGETVRSNKAGEGLRSQEVGISAARAAEDRRHNMMSEGIQIQNNQVGGFKEQKAAREGAMKLRKEFDALPEVKSFKVVRDAMQQVKTLATKKNATASDDIALVFSYMRMLDPNSVVREGEFATAQNAAGIPDRVRNMYNKALDGRLLTPSQRMNMAGSAAQVYIPKRENYNAVARQYQGYAEETGVNPKSVANTYSPKKKAPGAKGSPSVSNW